jgi:hypothetical protein
LPHHGVCCAAVTAFEAASEAEAIAKGAEEFKQPKEWLMAVERA